MKTTMLALVLVLGATAARADALQNGMTLFGQGKYAEAETQLRQAGGVEGQAWLSAALAKQRKWADAEGVASAALGQNAGHPVAAAALGEALIGQRKYDAAVQRMGAALAQNKDIAYAYYWRGQAQQALKRADLMVGDFQSFLRLAPNAPEAGAVKQVLATVR